VEGLETETPRSLRPSLRILLTTMPLVYLLYRCPRCGQDPMEGRKDEARCPACGTRFFRGGEGGLLRVLEPSGEEWEVASGRLAAAVDAWNEKEWEQPSGTGGVSATRSPGGTAGISSPENARTMPDSRGGEVMRRAQGVGGESSSGAAGARVIRRALVDVRRASWEAPFRFGGELLGFVESLGEAREGMLELSSAGVSLQVGEGEPERWPLLDIRAVQTSSSSLQISPREGGVIHFRFREDSPRRWEDLLHRALEKAYREAGLGKILEFQPRIVTR
jgi:hypothetical protein